MGCEMHHLHDRIVTVAPIISLNGDIRDLAGIVIHFQPEATEMQRWQAYQFVKAFDTSKNYDPNPEAFLDAVASNDLFTDVQFLVLTRVLRIADGAKRKFASAHIATMTDTQLQQLKALCDEHCVNIL